MNGKVDGKGRVVLNFECLREEFVADAISHVLLYHRRYTTRDDEAEEGDMWSSSTGEMLAVILRNPI